MANKIENKIKNLMSAVFEVRSHDINNESSPDNIDSWDSIKHMNLVFAIEEEFNIKLTDDNIIELINMKNIMEMVLGKITTENS